MSIIPRLESKNITALIMLLQPMSGVCDLINEVPSKIKRAGNRMSPMPRRRLSFSLTKSPATPAILNLYIKKNKKRGGKGGPPRPGGKLSFSLKKPPAPPAILNLDIKKNKAKTKKTIATIPCLVWLFNPELSLSSFFFFLAMLLFYHIYLTL